MKVYLVWQNLGGLGDKLLKAVCIDEEYARSAARAINLNSEQIGWDYWVQEFTVTTEVGCFD